MTLKQTLAGNVVHLKPDAVWVLEEHGVVARSPRAVLWRVHDFRARLSEDAVQSSRPGQCPRLTFLLCDIARSKRFPALVHIGDSAVIKYGNCAG